jgi:hypothetical protein
MTVTEIPPPPKKNNSYPPDKIKAKHKPCNPVQTKKSKPEKWDTFIYFSKDSFTTS